MSTMVTMRLVLAVVFGLISANSIRICWDYRNVPVGIRFSHLLCGLLTAGIAAWHLAKFIGWLAM